jgi:drug/metabolite transporter (DMT)-like permease
VPPRAMVLLALIVVVWGANWPLLKLALDHSGPLWFAVLRLVLGGACLVLVLAPMGRLTVPTRQDWSLVLSVGLLQMAAFGALINAGLISVSAGRSAILAYTTPLWVAPGAVLLLGEKLDRVRLAGLALGLAGVAVLFNPLEFDWSDGRALAGNGFLLAAALAWAIAILHVRGHRWAGSPLALAPWQMLVSLPPLTALAWVVEGPPDFDLSAEFLWLSAYNGPVATAFALWAAVTVTRMLPAITVSLAFLCVPAAGLLFSAWWLGEPLTATNLAGLGLIGAGVAMVAWAERS